MNLFELPTGSIISSMNIRKSYNVHCLNICLYVLGIWDFGNWGFHSEFGTYFTTELAFSHSCHQSNPHPRIRIFWGFVGTFSRNFSQNMIDFLTEWCFLSPNYPHFKIKIPTKPINTGFVRILHYSNSS